MKETTKFDEFLDFMSYGCFREREAIICKALRQERQRLKLEYLMTVYHRDCPTKSETLQLNKYADMILKAKEQENARRETERKKRFSRKKNPSGITSRTKPDAKQRNYSKTRGNASRASKATG